MDGLFAAFGPTAPEELRDWVQPLVRSWLSMARKNNSYALTAIALAIAQRAGISVDALFGTGGGGSDAPMRAEKITALTDYPPEILACMCAPGYAWARAITTNPAHGLHLTCNAAFDARIAPRGGLHLRHLRHGLRLICHEDDEATYYGALGAAWSGRGDGGAAAPDAMRTATAARAVRLFDRVAGGFVACRTTTLLCVDGEGTVWTAAHFEPLGPAQPHDGCSDLPMNAADAGVGGEGSLALALAPPLPAASAREAAAGLMSSTSSAAEAALQVAEVALGAAVAAAKCAEASGGSTGGGGSKAGSSSGTGTGSGSDSGGGSGGGSAAPGPMERLMRRVKPLLDGGMAEPVAVALGAAEVDILPAEVLPGETQDELDLWLGMLRDGGLGASATVPYRDPSMDTITTCTI